MTRILQTAFGMRIPTAVGVVLTALVPLALYLSQPGLARAIDWHLHACWSSGFSQALGEGTWIPRWIANANAGYGAPVFLYYPPLAYYLLSVGLALGDFEIAFKLLTALSAALLGFGVYFWLRFVTSQGAALVGAASALAAPAVWWAAWRYNFPAQTLAIALLPWLLAGADRCRSNAAGGPALITLGVFLQLVTHFPTAMMSAVTMLAYFAISCLSSPWRPLVRTIGAAAAGAALAAWAWVPAVLDAALVHLDFVREGQWAIADNLLFRAEGLVSFPDDAFAWSLVAASTAAAVSSVALSRAITRRKWRVESDAQVTWFGTILIVFVLSTAIAAPIYDMFWLLEFVQFGWRWQPIVSLLAIRILMPWLAEAAAPVREKAVAAILFAGWWAGAIALTTGSSAIGLPSLDRTSANDIAWASASCPWSTLEHRPASMGDQWHRDFSLEDAEEIDAVRGRVRLLAATLAHHRREYQLQSDFDALVRVRHLHFAGWEASLNGAPLLVEPDREGMMALRLPPGESNLVLAFRSTRAERFAQSVTLLSLIIGCAFLTRRWWRQRARAGSRAQTGCA